MKRNVLVVRRNNIYVYPTKFFALFFALGPFLWLYELPVIHINAAFFPSIFLAMFLAINVMLKRSWKGSKSLCYPLIIAMFIYIVVNYFFNNSTIYNRANTNITSILSFFWLLLISSFAFKDKHFRENYRLNVENIAIFMSVIILFQYVLYYLFKITISYDRSFLFPFQDYFSENVKQYISVSTMVSDSGLLRPSAFFLEPAHFSQYCSVGLVSLLLRTNSLKNYKAIFVSIGIVLTTSGLGIATVMFLWGMALVFNNNGVTRKSILRIILGALVIIIIFCLMYVFVGSFRYAVNRIFIAYNGHNTAIEGRLWSRSFLYKLSLKERIFGKNYKNIPVYGMNNTQYFMTGIVELLYCQGILGTAIFLSVYIWMMLKAYQLKEKLCFMMLIAYLPYLVLANFMTLYIIIYFPFAIVDIKRNRRG